MIGPNVSLSAGMVPGQECVTDPVVRIGDRCLIGRGVGSSGTCRSRSATTWTGHHIYITDQNQWLRRRHRADLPPGAARASGDDR
jgi:hypothetical protein